MLKGKILTSSPLRLGLCGSSVGRSGSVHRGRVQDAHSTRFSRSDDLNSIRKPAGDKYTEQNTRFPSTFIYSAGDESGDEPVRNGGWGGALGRSKAPVKPAGLVSLSRMDQRGGSASFRRPRARHGAGT
jgi:hypothetical protein